MPKTFRNYFITNGDVIYYRQKTKNTYEARYRKHGFNISKSAPTIALLKSRMLQAFKEVDKQLKKDDKEKQNTPKVPTTLNEFTEYFFEKFYKRKVSEGTYRNNCNLYRKNILPLFNKRQIKSITSLECQNIIDNLANQGKNKTATEIKSLLNIIFEMAKKHNIIQHNPIDIIVVDKYEKQHGTALSKAEEKQLLAQTAGTPLQIVFAIALYTGLRPNEYKTARIEGKFIVAVNSKRKNGEIEYKKIPITPMLEPYLVGTDTFKLCRTQALRDALHDLFPHHKLYDLRTTFYTRCQECGVAEVAIKKFVGHSLGGLAETYTDLSDDFLLNEAKKFKY